MAEIIHFLLQHWMLSGSIIILIVLLMLNEWVMQRSMAYQLTPQEAIEMINHHQAVVVDLRDKSQFETAHIVDARLVPETEFESKVNLLSAYKKKPLILMCAQGSTAPQMVQRLVSMGYEQVYCLAGGLEAWQKENLPLLTKSKT